jgi:lysophospholipase L1-like esterase
MRVALGLAVALAACAPKASDVSGGTPTPDAEVEAAGPPDDGSGDAGVDTAGDATDGGPDPFDTFWSGTTLGIPGNELLMAAAPTTSTYRTYVKPRVTGTWRWAFYMSNATDSTFGPGAPHPNMPGGSWRIEAAYFADAGPAPGSAGAVVAGTQVSVTFAGNPSRTVDPGERFWSDPVEIDVPDGHLLAFTWAVSSLAAGPVLPFTSAPFVTSYQAIGQNIPAQESSAGFNASTDPLVAPPLFAYDRPVQSRLCFLGDSITQGIGSTRDSYGFWVADIADGLGPDAGVWNLGSGWARAADAASDGYWLAKTDRCTEVAVILGVNDILNSMRTSDQLLGDLGTIMGTIKARHPSTRVILFTVPTFNLTGQAYTTWAAVNDAIRTAPPAGADLVFDIAAVQSQPAPNDGKVKPEYMTGGDAHPNNVASAAIASAFLAWYPPP